MTEVKNVVDTVVSNTPSVDQLVSSMVSNDVFMGFLALSLLGMAAMGIKTTAKPVFEFIKRQTSVKLEITNNDDAFIWFSKWLEDRGATKKIRRLRTSNLYVKGECPVALGEGRHFMFIKGRPYFISKTMGDTKSKAVFEQYTVTYFGRSKEPIMRLLGELQDMVRGDESSTRVFSWVSNGWALVSKDCSRKMDTVVLDPSQKSDIVSDLGWFIGNKEWFTERGVPYRRGYLFYGPPGTGKSSLVSALASHFNRNVYSINLKSLCSDSELQDAFFSASREGIILLEDIDCVDVVAARSSSLRHPVGANNSALGEDNDSDKPLIPMGITLSGLLNVIDGVGASEDRVIIMTTNNPDNLDKALMRPGRVDRKWEIGLPDWHARKEMYIRFFPEDEEGKAEAMANKTVDYTPAEMQCLFMQNISGEDQNASI